MRLDKYLVNNGFSSRTKAARALEEGRVFVNGKRGKASQEVSESDVIDIEQAAVSFVSEGGFKLKKALDDFSESVAGSVCIDIGASTGGFTDCLLQYGAACVCCVDVGESQLDASLSKDKRVRVMDRVNARYLTAEDFPESADVVTADVSFISLKLVLPAVAAVLKEDGRAFVLVKPQFECGGAGQDKHGIVKDAKIREKAVSDVCAAASALGLAPQKLTSAPVHPKKNIEYVLLLKKGGKAAEIRELLRSVF